jgi:Domain of unknown function (DUF5666)
MWKKIAIATGAGAVLIGGGAAAVAAAASADTSGTGTSATPSATASGTPSKPATKPGRHERGLRVAGALGRFEHAEWVSKDGTANVTHDAVHGTVTSVSATSISVKAADGYGLTFTVNADTKVRVRDTSGTGKRVGQAGTISDVKSGDNVLVSGIKSGSTVTAKHVLDGLTTR